MESVLGIEVLEDKIKILEARATEKGWQLLRFDCLSLPSGIVKDGILGEPKLIADKVSSFLKENKIFAKKAFALIAAPYIFTRLIRLPHNLSDEQIQINLEAEINQYQVFRGKENIIGFRRVEEISDEGVKKINLLFLTIPKAIVESYLKTIGLAGLDLAGVDIPIFSVARLLENVDFESSSLEAVLLVLIGKKYIDACIIKGNRPRFLQSIEVDIVDFEKERELFISRVVSAIKLLVNFYQARFMQGEEIARVIINPMIKGFDNIDTLLQEKIPQIPIKISNPLNKNYIIEKEKIKDLEELSFSYSGLMGAVLRLENKNQPYNLDLLLEQKTQRQYRFNQVQLLLISLSFLLAAAVVSFAVLGLKINLLQKRISRLSLQFKQPSLELKWALSVKEKRDVLGAQLKDAEQIINSAKKLNYFKPIARAMVLTPQSLWLTAVILEEDNKYLFLTGQSRSEKPIFDYVSGLSESGCFDSVEIASSKNEVEKIKFTIKCSVK